MSVTCCAGWAFAGSQRVHATRATMPPQRRRTKEAHKNNFADLVAAAIPEHARAKPIELWWQDEPSIRHTSAIAWEAIAPPKRFAPWNLWLIPPALESQGTLTRISAQRGSRPPAPRDCRYSWAELAKGSSTRSLLEWPAEATYSKPSELVEDCPARGTGAALVLPYANAEAILRKS